MPRRLTVAALLLVLAVGMLVIALTGGRWREDQSHSIGVLASTPVVDLRPGQEVCEGPIAADSSIEVMSVVAATNVPGPGFAPGPELMLRARRWFGGPTLASVSLAEGYSGIATQIGGRLDRPISADTRFVACVENRGRRVVAFLGETFRPGYAVNTVAEARMGGRVLEGDLGVYFPAEPKRRLLEMVPDMVDRAAVFRPSWIGPWTFWLVLALMCIGLPIVLVMATLAAAQEDLREEQALSSGDSGAPTGTACAPRSS